MMGDFEDREEEVNNVDEVSMLKQQLADAQRSIEALAAKKDELYKETKAAKAERQRQAELAEQAKREQLSIAEKNGEFEKLYKQAQEEKQALIDERNKEKQERRSDKIAIEAGRIASKLTNGDANKAELLSNFVSFSLSKLADEYGNVDVDVVNSITQQFEADKRYSPLLASSQAAGGSATGNTRSAGVSTQEISQADFNKLNPMKKLEVSKLFSQGKIKII